jgi:hypothetical protein
MAMLLYWMSFLPSVIYHAGRKKALYAECFYSECQYTECLGSATRTLFQKGSLPPDVRLAWKDFRSLTRASITAKQIHNKFVFPGLGIKHWIFLFFIFQHSTPELEPHFLSKCYFRNKILMKTWTYTIFSYTKWMKTSQIHQNLQSPCEWLNAPFGPIFGRYGVHTFWWIWQN